LNTSREDNRRLDVFDATAIFAAVIHLAIDTNTMRRHLFGGWPLMTFLAARAREGRLQVHVPFITHKEILTGIRDHVEDLTAREKLHTGLAEIAKGEADERPISELLLLAQQTRGSLYTSTIRRYEAWIASAQAEIIHLTLRQATAAWEAYFAGNAPFRRAKSRTDLPDAFVLQALVEASLSLGTIHFIVEDKPFREACAAYPTIVCHRDIYGFCLSQQLALDVAREKQLQKRQLPIAQIERSAGGTLKKKLPGLVLRVPADSEAESEKLKIEAVRSVQSCCFDPNSVIHLVEDDYLLAFTATTVLQCELTGAQSFASDSTADRRRAANYLAKLCGHMLAHAPADASPDQLSMDIDAVNVTSATLADDQDLITIVRPPEFVTDRWFERYLEAITAPGRIGIVIVAGSKQIYRKRVAEHLLRVKQRRDPDLGALHLISYPPEFSNALLYVKSSWGPFGKNDLFEKAAKTSAKAIAISVEEYDWLAPALGFVIHNGGFVVATMKRTTSVSAIVRELHSHGRDMTLEHLRGVVIVTAADDERIKFRAATGGEWGDGSWWGILEHDKLVGFRQTN
jgi:hypothetical protein